MNLLVVCYLIASIAFIIGLKMLSNPAKARHGNGVAAAGMGLAIIATIFLYKDGDGSSLRNHWWIFGGIAIGSIIGVLAARKVKMTAMPEMVSLFNGMGGICAALISVIEFEHLIHSAIEMNTVAGGWRASVPIGQTVIILIGLIIGSISFAGSIVAWGKLNGRIKDFAFRAQQLINIIALIAIVILSILLVFLIAKDPSGYSFVFYIILGLSLAYGLLFVFPIGGADMPVVISLLNSFTGVAAACGGFLYDNKVMLTGGILVGAAGTLLTILMCKAMNRSLLNVLIGSFGSSKAGVVDGKEQGTFKEIAISDAAVVMSYANRVMIVPGYGLAVAQAQHVCHELEKLLESKNVEVLYAIHPVAGRMPGHMNVLLAESDVSYERLLEMEQANEMFPNTDVVLVLGANDVVNPAAKSDPGSPIYGMPVLDVAQAKTIVVNKRSMKPGYAGIENELFFHQRTSMLFGDAKKVLQDLVSEIKNL